MYLFTINQRRGIMKNLFLLTSVFLLFSSCSPAAFKQATIEMRTDEYDGYSLVETKNNYLPNDKMFQGSLQLNPKKLIQEDGSTSYSIQAIYNGENWIFIETGESMVFLIDGEREGLITSRGVISREVLYGGNIEERAIYPVIDPEIYHKIARANSVKVKVSGDDYYIERSLSDKNKKLFLRFYSNYVNQN